MWTYLIDSIVWSFAFGSLGAVSTLFATDVIGRPQRGRRHRRDHS